MKSASPPQAIIITNSELPETARSISKRLECDCACSASMHKTNNKHLPEASFLSTRPLVRPSDVFEAPLDTEYSALFNTCGDGGVVVANRSACKILKSFDHPVPMENVRKADIFHFEQSVRKFLQSGLLQDAMHNKQPSFGVENTLSVWLHMTNACNLRCSYCYIKKKNESMGEITGRAALDAAFRSAKLHDFKTVKVKYAGGEPSLKSELVLLLHDHAHDLAESNNIDLQDVLLSNGVSLSYRFIQELEVREIGVMISIDGVGPYHDTQRSMASGTGSFRQVECTIERLIKAGLPPHLSITITRNNLDGLPGIVRFALERNLTFSFNFYREHDYNDPILRFDDQPMIKALCKAFTVIEEFLPPWNLLGTILDRGQLLEPRQRSCGVGQNYIVVDHLGRIAQCHMDIERTIGDVFAVDPLALVQQSGDIRNLPVDEKNVCRECRWRYWCSGGCAIVAHRAGRSYAGRSPNCNIYKAIYPKAIRLEGLRLLKYAEVHPC